MHDLDNLQLTVLLGLGSVGAGLVGALTGLGGGVVIVPMLVLAGVDLRYAVGAALVSVIATSSGAAAAYVKEGYSNVRVGMFLEVATTLGALSGAYLAGFLPTAAIAVIFGLVLLGSAYLSWRPRPQRPDADPPDPVATFLRLDGAYPTPGGPRRYHVHGVPLGFGLMFVAGALSGLLGIGSGALKVLAMDPDVGIPVEVSTATGHFLIRVTAAASAGIYLGRGYVVPGLAMPVMLGVLAGALLGTRVLVHARVKVLRLVFSLVILALALQMIIQGLLGKV